MANEATASFRLDRVRQGGEESPFVPEQAAFRDLIGDPPVHNGLHPESPKPPMLTLLGATYRLETEGVGYQAILVERIIDAEGTVQVETSVAANDSKTVELPAGAYRLVVL